MLDLKKIDSEWTIFLDRDGVINEEKLGEYILHWDYFIFSNGVLDAFKKISDTFHRVIIVTNQKGVGKGLMTKESLAPKRIELTWSRCQRILSREATPFATLGDL